MSTFRTPAPGCTDGTVAIGVAVAVPEPWASELQEYRLAIGDPTAMGVPTHVTLLPPMVVPSDLAPVEEWLNAAVAGQRPFDIRLAGTGTFRPVSPVVFINLVQGALECAQLAEAVRGGPLDVDLDFPYHPHVTVAHHVGDADLDKATADLAEFECSFTVDRFHLYVHQGQAGWKSAQTFAL